MFLRTVRKIAFLTVNIWSERDFLKLFYYGTTGQLLDLDKPKTFCDKLNWLKLYYRRIEFSTMVDKVSAKDFVASIIGNNYIIPNIQVFKSVDEIDIINLPQQFVIKCSHDSGGVYICRDKHNFDFKTVKKKLNKALTNNFVKYTKEYPYKNVKPQILIEELLSDGYDDLDDYKFYCFSGKAIYCQVISGRNKFETVEFYDRNWKLQPFVGLNLEKIHVRKTHRACPENFNEMLYVADKLSSSIDTPFVRIDLYNIKGKIYFGEITFFPASGMGCFYPKEWNERLGELISI